MNCAFRGEGAVTENGLSAAPENRSEVENVSRRENGIGAIHSMIGDAAFRIRRERIIP